MKLSTKGRYAVMAMADLAMNGTGKPVSLAEISHRQQISLSYLEQLFARLRRANLVKSARGPGGGYYLSRESGEIFVSQIILAVDEPIRVTRCIHTSNKLKVNKKLSHDEARKEIGCMPGGGRCLTHNLWERLGHAIHDFLAKETLQDVIEKNTPRKITLTNPKTIISRGEQIDAF